jgi:predicted ATP-binding protein involved in virulence
MSSSARLRVDRLSLSNFRCFSDCTIEFHPELVVLVAENGRGKTAILDAVRIALGFFVDTIAGTHQTPGFTRADVRLVQQENGVMAPALPTNFIAEGIVIGEAIRWSRARTGYVPRSRTSKKDAEGLRQAAIQLRRNLESSPHTADGDVQDLPLVASYGTDRLWNGTILAKATSRLDRTANRRLDGYTDCMALGSSFKGLIDWYRQKAYEIRDPAYSTDLTANLRLLATVKEATRVVLGPTGWCELDWDFDQDFLVVHHPNWGRLPLSSLSDGVRNMIALIADVARRCANLNPHLGETAARQTPGVLLIDEIDMHLHPSWQQLVVDLLRKAFPSLQIILSTHSPHVLSTVNKESIRVIQVLDGETTIKTPSLQTRGVMSADVLSSIMGVDPVPQIEEAAWLIRYRGIIEDGGADSEEAIALRSKLVLHFGESHPLIADCDRLIRFQAFRLKRKGPGET